MSIATLIIGMSGTGKSSSLRNLSPEETLLIQVIRKPLPFRATDWKYKKPGEAGNILVADGAAEIITIMRKTTRKIIVIDDFQYMLANEFMRRTDERGFDKFTDIGKHAWEVIGEASRLDEDKRVYFLSHSDENDAGVVKMKTIGKLLDEKIAPEGMFTIVLRTIVQDSKYLFSTRNSGSDVVKTPMDMFADQHIPNDLAEVDAAIRAYYGITSTQEAA